MFEILVSLWLLGVAMATPPDRSLPRVGIFYSAWHAEAFHAQDYVRQVYYGSVYCYRDKYLFVDKKLKPLFLIRSARII